MLEITNEKSFEKFLRMLHEDRERAAVEYLALRERLEKFFEWRGFDNVEELTDIVFDRIIKKITKGEVIENTEAYSVSIAKFVLLEARRENFKTTELEDNQAEISDGEDFDQAKDKQFKCLDKCLKELPLEKRKLLIGYFDTDEKTLIPKRKKIADKIGINLNTLRIRISRLKTKVEKCTKKCCGKS